MQDAQEQSQRFDAEIQFRQQAKRPDVIKDERLIKALQHGLPECSGIAIGLDRLLMILTQSASIEDVLSFPVVRA